MVASPNNPFRPIIFDLFAGVGGLSLGAARAGFEVRAVVELDPIAIKTHALNFPAAIHIARDISSLSGAELLRTGGVNADELDGLIGGPPCQGFSVMGHQRRDDARNQLFFDFFRLVMETRPKFFIAENVPGILAPSSRDFVETALSMVSNTYSLFEPIIIRAADLGAATTRTRVFIVGIDDGRMNANLSGSDIKAISSSPIYVGHALSGLPSIRSSWAHEAQGWRRVFDLPSDSFFERVTNSVPIGVGDASAIERLHRNGEVSGCIGTKHTELTISRFAKVRPGESDPVSRSPRLNKLGFCPTIRAGTAADRGSFQAVRPIHPGSPRVITPREAARLQGFPDWFQFHATKWHSFRQIGNSVSPIVAECVLSALHAKL